MFTMRLLALMICLVVRAVIAAPHRGMVNLPTHRDVGVIYTEAGYSGTAHFIMEAKGEPQCQPLHPTEDGTPQSVSVKSVEVCEATCCTFYMGDNCDESDPQNYFVDILGHGDIADFVTPGGNEFKYALCGPDRLSSPESEDGSVRVANFSIVPTPHVDGPGMTRNIVGTRAIKSMVELLPKS